MRRAILQALEDRYNAQISEADATIKIYLESSVGIGEHPQHIDEVDKQGAAKVSEGGDSGKIANFPLTPNMSSSASSED